MSKSKSALAVTVVIVLAAMLTPNPLWAADQESLPDLAGVYWSDEGRLTLANHPSWPRAEYIGLFIVGQEQWVYPMKVSNDSIKGCHGVLYNGSLEKQQAVELTLDGTTLLFRYYDGPTLRLKRLPAP
jgi:hypothetical protein